MRVKTSLIFFSEHNIEMTKEIKESKFIDILH